MPHQNRDRLGVAVLSAAFLTNILIVDICYAINRQCSNCAFCVINLVGPCIDCLIGFGVCVFGVCIAILSLSF